MTATVNPLSSQCTARSKRSGDRCQHRVVGGGVCHLHGGKSPGAQRKRLERVALAEALAADPRRSPDQVLADVLHTADHLMRKARTEVDANRPTAETMAKLLEAMERAGGWARSAISADVDQRQARVAEVQAVALAGAVRRILDRLDLTPAQRELIPVVVPAELERLSSTPADPR